MSYDYVIVGAGSAGCVLANRLTENPSNRVLLLEAGPENYFFSIAALNERVPAACVANLQNKKTNWFFEGAPEPCLENRTIQHFRGKTLGGSSAINGMVFIRGHALDFDNWQQLGCRGWSYADVLPYFKKMECYSSNADNFRGKDGLTMVKRPIPSNEIDLAFLKAGKEAGYPTTNDINGYKQEGFGVLDSTVFKGERWSTARAYLDIARKRPNLTITSKCHVEKILFNANKAVGLIYRDRNNREQTVSTTKEVILSAGAVGTPHLLMLSGLGPKAHLEAKGVKLKKDIPGVGKNLSDHPDFILKFDCLKPVSIWPKTKLIPKLTLGLQWLISGKGLPSSNLFEVVGCIRSDPKHDYPDLQLTILPLGVDFENWKPMNRHAFSIHLGLMRPHSKGELKLSTKDPQTPPQILINYLKDRRDIASMQNGIKIVRNIVRQSAFEGLTGTEIFPGEQIKSKQELENTLSANVSSQWHLTGTAKMGSSTDKNAVVNELGQVYGIKNLRIVDASIMPAVTNGNTNSPTIMIAEKLSDSILGNDPLPRSNLEIWQQ